MNVSSIVCPGCGRRVAPGALEAKRCPDCGREYTGGIESNEVKGPVADELFFRREQRAKWGICFWVVLLVGPLYAIAFTYFKWNTLDIVLWLPARIWPYAEFCANPIVALCLCAAGAGFCLANLWFPRERFRDVLAYTFLIWLVFLAIYGGLFFAGSMVREFVGAWHK